MTIRVVVAEDEPIPRRRLVRLIEETGEATVVAACSGGESAVKRTRELNPDVLFLDVQMPDLDGFGVVAALAPRPLPAIVFVTGYDQYAQRAFDVHAVDYLLKPYGVERFREAFERVKERLAASSRRADDARIRALLREYLESKGRPIDEAADEWLERVAIAAGGTQRILRTADVDYWETSGNYVRLYIGTASHLLRMTATQLEARLDPKRFVRVHRRFIVNLDRVVEMQPWFNGDAVLVLKTRATLRLSRSYRERFNERLLGSDRKLATQRDA